MDNIVHTPERAFEAPMPSIAAAARESYDTNVKFQSTGNSVDFSQERQTVASPYPGMPAENWQFTNNVGASSDSNSASKTGNNSDSSSIPFQWSNTLGLRDPDYSSIFGAVANKEAQAMRKAEIHLPGDNYVRNR